MKRKTILCAALIAAMTTSGDEIHTVVKRDNLWNLSGEYLGNAFLWPDIWKVNPQIKNPHLIYPGEKITVPAHLTGSSTTNGDSNSTTSTTISAEEFTNTLNGYYLNRSDLYSVEALRGAPYLETANTKDSSIASIDDDSRQLFTLGNSATIKLTGNQKPQVGDQLDILSIQKGSNKTRVVIPAGSAKVTSVSEGSARILITDGWYIIRNKDLIVPSREFQKYKSPTIDMTISEIESKMITIVHESAMIKPFQTIIIDAGKNKDVVVGDLFIATAENKKGTLEVEPAFRGIILRSDAESATLLVEEVRSYSANEQYSLKRAARLTFQ